MRKKRKFKVIQKKTRSKNVSERPENVSEPTENITAPDENVTNSSESVTNSSETTVESASKGKEASSENKGGFGNNPLNRPVTQREYTAGMQNQGHEPPADIPEPTYTGAGEAYQAPPPKPKNDGSQQPPSTSPRETGSQQQPGPQQPPAGHNTNDNGLFEDQAKDVGPMPGINELTPEQKREAAGRLVDVVLGVYERLHDVGQWYVKIGDDKLNKLTRAGVNLEQFIPLAHIGRIKFIEFVGDYNKQVSEVLVVSEDFKKQVREPMINIFVKHDWGLTDEAYLVYMFAEDIAVKTTMVVSLKSNMNIVLRDIVELMKQQQSQTPPPPPRPQKEKKQSSSQTSGEILKEEEKEVLEPEEA